MKFSKEKFKEIENELVKKGYIRMAGHYKSEDYGYWKNYKENNIVKYTLTFLVYDFSKYEKFDSENPIGIQCEFMSGDDCLHAGTSLSMGDDELTINKFEDFCKEFYDTLLANK